MSDVQTAPAWACASEPAPPANHSAGTGPSAPQIISASRRTDIPAFYLPWFMGRLRAGTVRCPHPFTQQLLEISLRPEHVHSIVFWTKNGARLLEHVDELEARGYDFVCHYTITGMPPDLEPGVPDWRQTVASFVSLSRRLGPGRVWWRFDPILLTPEQTPAVYLARFAALAAALEGATERCYLSFAALYGKVQRRLRSLGVQVIEPSLDARRGLAQEMAAVGADHGLRLLSCCNDELVGGEVGKAHCVDARDLRALFPGRSLTAPARPTRRQCGCCASRDIGMYDTCPHQCVYCYANQSGERVRARHGQHDPAAATLVPLAGPG